MECYDRDMEMIEACRKLNPLYKENKRLRMENKILKAVIYSHIKNKVL